MIYKFLPHDADVKIEIIDDNLEKAFRGAALMEKSLITDSLEISKKITKKILIRGEDNKSLLYNFLEEFIYLLDAENFILSEVEEIKINEKDFSLEATIIGDKADNYDFTNDVKAITYSEMLIEKNEKNVKLQFVLDV